MKCQLPECKLQAGTEWAKVPVCQAHYNAIMIETLKYYQSGGETKTSVLYMKKRPLYTQIAHHIPWARPF